MAASIVTTSREVHITQTCETAKEFVERFYRRLDQDRHTVKNMFEESGKLVFNGNGYVGLESIGKFYENLPKSFTKLLGFDAHEIDQKYLGGTPVILVSTVGSVRFGNLAESSKYEDRWNSPDPKAFIFFESFVITAKSGTWKIQSDNFRFQNSNTESMLKMDLWNVSMQE